MFKKHFDSIEVLDLENILDIWSYLYSQHMFLNEKMHCMKITYLKIKHYSFQKSDTTC